MSRELVRVKDVSAGYDGNIVLSHIDLTVRQSDFIGVIGPNGGGKTTLVKLLLGRLTPVEGTIEYAPELGHIGYLPQANATDRAFPITVREVVASGLQAVKGIFGRYGAAERAKVETIMERCGIAHLAGKTVGELSGGQLQRAFLCRALISSPRMLILDEPNTYVDNKFESQLYELLRQLNEQMAIVMVSHDLGTITSHVKSIACVNRCLHYHDSNIITQDELNRYECPIQLVTHGEVPHTVLERHKNCHCACHED
ncbi:MAG: ABC transporter ATP-binding protein [Rikenellaceae bacterium]|nr:ABC transporter ATP-binding protein [Rikenellaceae bacterium]MDE7355978.1 ABC transporter ATP-binding protein [Rikenellaceae bacterium]